MTCQSVLVSFTKKLYDYSITRYYILVSCDRSFDRDAAFVYLNTSIVDAQTSRF